MKKVIITGATGFIGGALTRRLLADGVTVYGIDIDPVKLEGMKQYGDFVPVVADFSVYDKLSEMITERGFDVFYHFAWQGVYGEAFKDYRLQLSNSIYSCDAIMQAISLESKKFVFSGTVNEHELLMQMGNVDLKPRYTCIYSSSKAASDVICKTIASNNNIEYNSGLIAMAYGEGNYSKMLPNVLMESLICNNAPKLIAGDIDYDLVYIDDIVNAFIAIGQRGKNLKSYYIGHRNLKTFKEFVTDIRDIINKAVELRFGEYPDNATLDYSLINLDELYNDTGFECTADFKESILKTANWLKSQPSTSTTGGGG